MSDLIGRIKDALGDFDPDNDGHLIYASDFAELLRECIRELEKGVMVSKVRFFVREYDNGTVLVLSDTEKIIGSFYCKDALELVKILNAADSSRERIAELVEALVMVRKDLSDRAEMRDGTRILDISNSALHVMDEAIAKHAGEGNDDPNHDA